MIAAEVVSVAESTIAGREIIFKENTTQASTLAVGDANYNQLDNPEEIPGYKPWAIAGFHFTGTNYKFASLNSCFIDNNGKIHWGWQNHYPSASVTINLTVLVVYIKV